MTNKTTHPTSPGKQPGGSTSNKKKEVVQVSHRTWKDNAVEFAALDRGEGWQFAILVACSVEKGVGQNVRGSRLHDRGDEKASAAKFAEVAGVGDSRVLRYYDAWQDAAAKGWVPDAASLSPDDVHNIAVPDQPWRAKDGGVYDASRTGGQINNTEQIAAKAARDPEYAKRLMSSTIKSSPIAAAAADQALEDRAREFRSQRPKPVERHDNAADDALHLIFLLRKAHKALAEAVEYAQNIRGAGADSLVAGVTAEVEWIRAACDALQEGANNGSLDEQIEAFLASETGR